MSKKEKCEKDKPVLVCPDCSMEYYTKRIRQCIRCGALLCVDCD